MKKVPIYVWLIIAYAILICMYGYIANAAMKNLHVEWTPYTPPANLVVSGFSLYKGSAKVCDFVGQNITNGDCAVDIVSLAESFTLTAKFTDGTESPKSVPYVFQIPIPAPTDIKITVY